MSLCCKHQYNINCYIVALDLFVSGLDLDSYISIWEESEHERNQSPENNTDTWTQLTHYKLPSMHGILWKCSCQSRSKFWSKNDPRNNLRVSNFEIFSGWWEGGMPRDPPHCCILVVMCPQSHLSSAAYVHCPGGPS